MTDAHSRNERRHMLALKYYPRPLTHREWAHSCMCHTSKPDNRSEFSKIRELMREGKLPNNEATHKEA